MRRNFLKKTALIISIFIFYQILIAKAQNYSFIIAGHMYGSPIDRTPYYAANSIVSNIKFIKSLNPTLFISLGDNCRNGNDSISLKFFDETIIDQLNIPFFTAYGNHDGDRKLIEKRLNGKTYFSHVKNSELFIFIDSELENNIIYGECLDFVINTLKNAEINDRIKNIFILSHKLIWSQSDTRYQIVYKNSNEGSYNYSRFKKFCDIIHFYLTKQPKSKKIYWLSGDIGQFWSLPLFYDCFNNITYIATGLGDGPGDLILNVSVKNSIVEIKAYDLESHKALRLNQYNLKKWTYYFSFTEKTKRFLTRNLDKRFIIGLSVGALIGFCFHLFKKINKLINKKKNLQPIR